MRPPSPDHAPFSVLLVSEPGIDGVFQYVRELARSLIARGVRTHLAYSSLRGAPPLHELVEEVRAAGGHTLDLRVGNGPRPADVSAVWRLWRLVRTVRPDVIHAHSSKAGALVRGLAPWGLRAKVFYTPHAYFEMHESAPSRRKAVFTTIERLLGRTGTTVNVSLSEAKYGRAVIGVPADRQCTILTGIDCARFSPAADPAAKAAARATFGLPATGLLLGTVARYSGQKDPLTLYRALLPVLENCPSLAFAHLGRGDLWPEVDALIAAAPDAVRARIFRIEASTDTPAFYRSLDAFILPSRFEGLALSALEAMATGLPLILTDVPGNADLKEFALSDVAWAPGGDPESLSARIQSWAARPATPTNHRECALREFSAELMHQRMLELYQASTRRA